MPFVIYYGLSYILFYILDYVCPNAIATGINFSITDLFHQRNLFNGPLWFIICLFEVEILFYMLWRYVDNEYVRSGLILTIALTGFTLSHFDIFLPLWLDTACVAALYFYFGILLSSSRFVYDKIKPQWLIVGAALFYSIFYLFPVNISMSTNHYGNPILAIISGTSMILCILCICKMINNIGIIAWCGANSLTLLCTHHIIYRPIKYILSAMNFEYAWLVFALTMILEIPTVMVINRYFPILAGKKLKKKDVLIKLS